MRLADEPVAHIAAKAISMLSGMTLATSSEARTSRRNRNSTATTSRPPSVRFLRIVCVVRSTSALWS
jgi:hypothetical protein